MFIQLQVYCSEDNIMFIQLQVHCSEYNNVHTTTSPLVKITPCLYNYKSATVKITLCSYNYKSTAVNITSCSYNYKSATVKITSCSYNYKSTAVKITSLVSYMNTPRQYSWLSMYWYADGLIIIQSALLWPCKPWMDSRYLVIHWCCNERQSPCVLFLADVRSDCTQDMYVKGHAVFILVLFNLYLALCPRGTSRWCYKTKLSVIMAFPSRLAGLQLGGIYASWEVYFPVGKLPVGAIPTGIHFIIYNFFILNSASW